MIIAIFDVETTGLDKHKDSIIQFAGMKMNTETHEVVDSLNLYIRPIGNFSINPGAYFKHHIDAKFLEDKPTMSKVAYKIINFFDGVDNILTYNGNTFDISFLQEELNRHGFYIDFLSKNCYDAFLEEKRRNGISLENTYKRYRGKTMEEAGLSAHDALSDIKATYAVFISQQRVQPYGPEKMYGEDNIITDMIFEDQTMPCFTVGKYRQVSVAKVAEFDQGYLKWCVSDKSNFTDNTKKFIQQYIKD